MRRFSSDEASRTHIANSKKLNVNDVLKHYWMCFRILYKKTKSCFHCQLLPIWLAFGFFSVLHRQQKIKKGIWNCWKGDNKKISLASMHMDNNAKFDANLSTKYLLFALTWCESSCTKPFQRLRECLYARQGGNLRIWDFEPLVTENSAKWSRKKMICRHCCH